MGATGEPANAPTVLHCRLAAAETAVQLRPPPPCRTAPATPLSTPSLRPRVGGGSSVHVRSQRRPRPHHLREHRTRFARESSTLHAVLQVHARPCAPTARSTCGHSTARRHSRIRDPDLARTVQSVDPHQAPLPGGFLVPSLLRPRRKPSALPGPFGGRRERCARRRRPATGGDFRAAAIRSQLRPRPKPEGKTGSRKMRTKKEPKRQTRRTRKPPACAATLSVHSYADPPTSAWHKLWATMLREMSAELDGEQSQADPSAADERM